MVIASISFCQRVHNLVGVFLSTILEMIVPNDKLGSRWAIVCWEKTRMVSKNCSWEFGAFNCSWHIVFGWRWKLPTYHTYICEYIISSTLGHRHGLFGTQTGNAFHTHGKIRFGTKIQVHHPFFNIDFGAVGTHLWPFNSYKWDELTPITKVLSWNNPSIILFLFLGPQL